MIRIVSVAGLAIVQDGGRPGRMHEGIPPGGAMVPELLAIANRAAGNDDGAAAIEHYGALVVDAEGGIVQAATPEQLLAIVPGSPVHLLARRGRVSYLAVAGGLAVPPILGGRGALVGANFGRPLRGGDLLPVGESAGEPSPPPPPGPRSDAGTLRLPVILGPDSGDTPTLLSATFTISPVGNRTGIRLSGPPVRAAAPSGTSAPMVRGALQTTPSGELIVLGPDHPTTGGYPVVAVIRSGEVGRILGARAGTTVRFVR